MVLLSFWDSKGFGKEFKFCLIFRVNLYKIFLAFEIKINKYRALRQTIFTQTSSPIKLTNSVDATRPLWQKSVLTRVLTITRKDPRTIKRNNTQKRTRKAKNK